MSFWDFLRSPASVRLLVEFGGKQGVHPAKLLAGSRLTLAQLSDPNASVSPGQELKVITNLLHFSAHPADLGLEVGLSYHLSAYGILGYGMMSSATGVEALALAQQFLPLTYAFTVITYEARGESGQLKFVSPSDLDPMLQRFVVERAMGAACRLLHDVLGGDFQLEAIRLHYPRESQTQVTVPLHLFGAPVEFGGKENLLSFRREYLLRDLPQANPITVEMCKQMCAEQIERRRAKMGTATLIREYLDALPASGTIGLHDIARLLNTSERTLKRWLQSEGTSFSALQTAARHAKAEILLEDGRLSLTEVAEALGFSDLSTFSQAYKRWTGVAPSIARQRSKPA